MKEKILWGMGAAAGALLLRQFAEWVISDADWPQYARDSFLWLLQNPVMWTICGGVGVFVGWQVPEAFGERGENLSLDTILRQERGSARVGKPATKLTNQGR